MGVGDGPGVCVAVGVGDGPGVWVAVDVGDGPVVGVKVNVGVGDGLGVCVAVGVAVTAAAGQNPPFKAKLPPLAEPASGWPAVPPSW